MERGDYYVKKEEFIEKSLIKESSFSKLCSEYQISRKTGYILVKRYKEEGLSGVSPRSKKPLSSPFKTHPQIKKAILNV